MLRVFRVKNKAGNSAWVSADNPTDACDVAFALGDARKLENLKVVGESTDFPELTIKGHVAIQHSGTVPDIKTAVVSDGFERHEFQYETDN